MRANHCIAFFGIIRVGKANNVEKKEPQYVAKLNTRDLKKCI
jgi:hypothetical protein